MALDLSNAIDAYKSAVGRASGDTVSGIGKLSKIGENDLSAAAAAGKANIDQVVVAVAEAETTLNTVVAVRDKVLEAYREILRMPI